ncbi:MAG: DUF2461 domain-containing protein [Marinicaulis sp.]|nr:DUF2461 domain-containing protein [Marinicaulis sp.]NNE41910.1 DUF2461 domain-containing protein [Marinicaulis sp.]NNL90444.1 DUF2461 domain-containing protein [Marinicaulis sp.]
MTGFDGLPADYFKFFIELETNNNREWFNDNKLRFRESVQEPLAAFVEAMAPRLKKISRHIVADPRLNGGSVFRIYKDTRFSKDKSPYKTHGGVQFRHALGKDAHAPGFYVHLDPTEVFYGGGVWRPPSPQLMQIRTAIAKNGAAWDKVISAPAFAKRFDGIGGESLTRPPRGFDADHKFIADIKRKSFFAMAEAKPASAKKAAFVDDVDAAFTDAKPFMKFLCNAVDAPF